MAPKKSLKKTATKAAKTIAKPAPKAASKSAKKTVAKTAKKAAVKKAAAPRFTAQPRQVLAGSEKAAFVAAPDAQVSPAAGKLTVSVIVQRASPLNLKKLGKGRLTRAEYSKNHAADKADLKLVRDFAAEYKLVLHKDTPKPERRTVLLTGTVANMQKAFGVELKQVTANGSSYRVREGAITLPTDLAGKVVAVLGLDNRPQASSHFQIRKAQPEGGGIVAHAGGSSYTPVQVGQLYGFPAGANANGQTIGIIELGGGYKTADLTAYFKSLGMKAPTVTAVSVDGGPTAR
jgi:kumamolisin